MLQEIRLGRLIPEDIMRRWQAWLQELPKLQVSIDRCFKPPNFGEVTSTQLHHFSDASQQGYGAVTYLRITDRSGNTKCSFIMGKSRLAPMTSVTIPRMELSAAVICHARNSVLLFLNRSSGPTAPASCVTLKIKTNDFTHLWQME